MLWRTRQRSLLLGIMCMILANMTWAAEQPSRMREDKTHVQVWNGFVADILTLHQQKLVEQGMNKTTKVGGYASLPDFYTEEEYRDSEGRLVSRLQWERKTPQNLHAIELFIHDSKGRVIRDYAGAYLPHYRNAPTQTLLSLHSYNGSLHAFRTFDASADFLYEQCNGQYQGKAVAISLDIDEKEALEGQPGTILNSKAYAACFNGMSQTAGDYLRPQ